MRTYQNFLSLVQGMLCNNGTAVWIVFSPDPLCSSAKPSGAASKRKATAAESHELQRDGRSKKVRTVSDAAANAVVDVGLTVYEAFFSVDGFEWCR